MKFGIPYSRKIEEGAAGVIGVLLLREEDQGHPWLL